MSVDELQAWYITLSGKFHSNNSNFVKTRNLIPS